MSFQLTSDFVLNLLVEAAAGNPGPLTEALDPEVRWRIGSETQDDVAKTGCFVSIGELSSRERMAFVSSWLIRGGH